MPLFRMQDKPKIPVHIHHHNQYCIAISGKSGCGNSTVSKMLAVHLSLPLVNYTFRNLADEMGMHMNDIAQQAVQNPRIDWYIEEKQIRAMQAQPCILASRLAIWLAHGSVLRVYLQTSEHIRIQRIAAREKTPVLQAQEETVLRDSNDRKRLQKNYAIDIDDYSIADHTINTGDKEPEEIVQKIVSLYELMI